MQIKIILKDGTILKLDKSLALKMIRSGKAKEYKDKMLIPEVKDAYLTK